MQQDLRQPPKLVRLQLEPIPAEQRVLPSDDLLGPDRASSQKHGHGVEYAAEGSAWSGRVELAQLAQVFTWCQDRGIALAALGPPGHLFKYRGTASYLRWTTNHASTEASGTGKTESLRNQRDTIRVMPVQ